MATARIQRTEGKPKGSAIARAHRLLGTMGVTEWAFLSILCDNDYDYAAPNVSSPSNKQSYGGNARKEISQLLNFTSNQKIRCDIHTVHIICEYIRSIINTHAKCD